MNISILAGLFSNEMERTKNKNIEALMTLTKSREVNYLEIDPYAIPKFLENLFLAYEVVNPSFCS